MAIGMKRNRTYGRQESHQINGSLWTALALYIALRRTVSHSLRYSVAEARFTVMETYWCRGFQILMGPTASRTATIMGNTASFPSLYCTSLTLPHLSALYKATNHRMSQISDHRYFNRRAGCIGEYNTVTYRPTAR
jgi:hypothetical protein